MAETATKISIYADDKASNAFLRVAGEAEALSKKVINLESGAKNLFKTFIGYASLNSVVGTMRSLTDSMLQMSRLNISYQTIFGNEYGATQQLQHIYSQTQAVGLEFQASASSAKTFFSAAQGTSLQKDMNGIFDAVSSAGAALQLSSEDMSGIYLALGQMVSKGKVQAEELRGQLGERLPGAFRLAAQAMGMTTAELDKFMADGKLTAEDLLPKLAEVLKNKFASAANESANSVQGSINRMNTEWEIFKANVIGSDAIVASMNVVTSAFKAMNAETKSIAEDIKIIRGLEASGVKKTFVIDEGGESGQYTYTEQQKNLFKIAQNFQGQLTKATEDGVNAREAIYSKELSVVKDYLKNSKDSKRNSIENAKNDALASIKAAIDQRVAEGGNTASLIKDKADVLAEYKSQLEKLNKEDSGAVNKQFRFDTGLEQLKQEVSNMEATLNPASLGIDRIRQKLELEKQNAIAAAEAHAKLSVQRKEATPAEAEEKQALEVKKAELTYAQKLADAEEKGRQTRLEFYKEYASLSGNFEASIDAQTEAVKRQGEEYRSAGITEALVAQWEAMKRLETARDPLSGSIVSLRQYASEATNLAKGVGQVWTNAFSSIEGALVNSLNNQSVSLKNFFNQLLMDIERVAIRASITGPLASGISSFFSGFSWGGAQTTNPSSSWADFGVKPGASMPVSGFHRGGTVGADTPTFMRNVPMSLFYDAPRYHGGSSTLGYALSADEEAAILLKGEKVLNRQQTQAFNAGMSMTGVLGQLGAVGGTNWQQPQLNVYVQSSGDTTAKASAQPNNTGGFDLNIALVKMVDQGLASMGAQNSSEFVKYLDKTRSLGGNARSLYGKG
ncbi:tape measure protein [Desulfovibrio desulfuricans]|uniref:tape measure protein n=1 Tax=Desulfovibrio desulfuricans TaxID=876 RepID=UPI00177FFA6D|nr:tape measure protein [Desulfovibrio desulfuricans]MBD8896227.1 tape measure protein [Desulfovibrio desulfuricans]